MVAAYSVHAALHLLALDKCFALSSMNQIQPSLTEKMILAPLTKGGNKPFRRLCTDFGMDTSVSEMIYARGLLKGSPVEGARLRRSENEKTFGVQIATNQIEEGLNAIDLIQKSGADFVDLNCGCPIYDVTRRGLGSSLLRSPKKLHNLVQGLVMGSDIPITVKIRLGCEADSINCLQNVKALREAGVSAITIHGRTAQQGYSKDANWETIRQAVIESKEEGYGHIPIIGNGDILTYYEARNRMEETGVQSVMVGRGALTKPWIFQEFKDNVTWSPTAQERVQVYYILTRYMKDHFGDDDMGRKRAWTFLPWHFQFLSRYSPHPKEDFILQSTSKPLIQRRIISTSDDPLDILLSNRSTDTHNAIAAILWGSTDEGSAIEKMEQYAESAEFKQIVMTGGNIEEEDKVLANKPPGKSSGKWLKRQVRKPGPKRTEEEIQIIRAERAKKKQTILANGGEWPPN